MRNGVQYRYERNYRPLRRTMMNTDGENIERNSLKRHAVYVLWDRGTLSIIAGISQTRPYMRQSI